MASFPILTTPARRQIAFSIFAAATALFFAIGFGAATGLLAPWTILDFGPSDPHPELHRWHIVQSAATFGILFAGSLIALVRQPQARPLVAQFFVAGTVVLATSMVFFDRASLLLSVGIQVAALFPQRRQLLANPWSSLQRIDARRLALALSSAAFLAPDAISSLRSQIHGTGGEHATLNHWGLSFGLSILLVLAGLLAASDRPGSRALSVITGLALLYLGAGGLAIPDHDGSWGVTGGTLAALGGIAFLATGIRHRRQNAVVMRPGQPVPSDGD